MATYKLTVSTLTALVVVASPLHAQITPDPDTEGTIAIDGSIVTRTAGAVNNPINGTNWDTENQYWRNQYSTRSYYRPINNYSAYESAYRYGYDLYGLNGGRPYNELDQGELERSWTVARGQSTIEWGEAQIATQDAYSRLYNNQR